MQKTISNLDISIKISTAKSIQSHTIIGFMAFHNFNQIEATSKNTTDDHDLYLDRISIIQQKKKYKGPLQIKSYPQLRSTGFRSLESTNELKIKIA